MNDTKLTSLAIYKSMTKAIDEKIDKLRERIEKNSEKLKGPNKVGLIYKMSINSENKNYRDEIQKLTELNKSLNELYFSNSKKYSFPENIQGYFNNISSYLEENEIDDLRNTVNGTLKNTNRGKKENIKKAATEVNGLLSKLKLSDNKFLIYDGFNYKTTLSFESAAKKLENSSLDNLTPNYVSIKKADSKDSLPSNENQLIAKIEEMIANKSLEQNKYTDDIVANIKDIKESLVSKEKNNKLLLLLSNAITELKKIDEIDVSQIIVFLNNLEIKYKKDLEKIEKYLSKFNFEDVKKQVEIKKEVEEKERKEKNNLVNYENLAIELEKILTEEPDNYKKITEIKAQMAELAKNSGLTNNELELANTNGKIKYHDEKRERESKVESVKEKIAYEDELHKEVMRSIREEAIRELEYNNAFEGNYEVRNGDVYSAPMDKEAIIKRKMEELMSMADMTPEQRGLYDLKKKGRISSNATIDDLTPQQLNDIRIGYSDESYSFMEDYKSYKKREETKSKADTIYKEYIKYRASLKEKNEFLSFSNYARQMYKIDNMSETMVSETLKTELEEKQRGR